VEDVSEKGLYSGLRLVDARRGSIPTNSELVKRNHRGEYADISSSTEYGDLTILIFTVDRRNVIKAGDLGRGESERLARIPRACTEDHIGYALYVAQRGGKHCDAKVLTGFGGAGVVEVVKDYRGDTFRAVYTSGLPGPYLSFTPSRRNRKRDGKHRAGR
jgi:hypothetical protein